MPPAASFKPPPPKNRLLQAFAFDPSLSYFSIETAVINQLTLSLPWERLSPGPIGEYLEVLDVDPPSGFFYPPVDLDHPSLLVQDGLPPSEGTPQFHQQMVYAVASKTIQNFEQALGRRLLWSARLVTGAEPEYVPRLRLYPHALREANAYYSPQKKAILFGYFPASTKNPGNNLPGGMVFTCLSYDIIAHEVTHALLDGMHPYFTEPSNVDVIALHEAFADIVALFQHFSHPEVLRSQVAKTRGDLTSENLLAELAQQFGQAIGNRGALRSAIGEKDPKTDVWKRKEPDPAAFERTQEPHQRGAILLAAVFDAFLTVYKFRSADLLRIATGGTGILPRGAIHPDLVNRLSEEAAKIAGRMLRICIRALDYCPPVDVTFGEYLRGLITADYDLVADDRDGYRLALVEAFRRRGIYPAEVRNLSQESLLWQPPENQEAFQRFFSEPLRMGRMQGMRADTDRRAIFDNSAKYNKTFEGWLTGGRLTEILMETPGVKEKDALEQIERALRLKLFPDNGQRTILRGEDGRPALSVNSVRPAYRVGPTGQNITDLVVEITQQRRGYLDQGLQNKVDKGKVKNPPRPDFVYRGGVTILIDMESGQVRYAIGKSVKNDRRLEMQRRFYEERRSSLGYTYFGDPNVNYYKGDGRRREPFALLHRGEGLEEDF